MINQTAATISARLNSNPGAHSLLQRSMTWMSEHYDERVGLLRAPGSSGHGHLVRESIWYALGLAVARSVSENTQPEASQRLTTIVRAVLKAQWHEPGKAWHGTFRRSPEEPDPPENAKIWRDYDPNWRQFIGTVLVILLRLEAEDLLADEAEAIRDALKLCVQGESAERVPSTYTNIALMKAWLEVEAASLIGVGDRQRGLRFAQEITKGFNQHHSFAEYNSPTYYGINLYALGLWQLYSTEPELQRWGQQIAQSLWRDMADYYHPVMKNFCGPWSRAYGMDMQRYVAAVGLWIWSLAGEADAPFPMAGLDDGTMEHAHDFALGPLAAITASPPTPETLVRFRQGDDDQFSSESCLDRVITEDPLRRAKAWMTPELMVGLETAQISFHGNRQYHPFTVHWLEDNELRWLHLRFSGRLQGAMHPGRVQLTLIPDPGAHDCLWQSSHPIEISNGQWHCGRLTMMVNTDARCRVVANGVRMDTLEEQTTADVTFHMNGATD